MKDKTLKEKYDVINEILDLAEEERKDMDFSLPIKKIDFLSNACRSILLEFGKIQIIGERISTKRTISAYCVDDIYDENMMKEDLKEMLEKYSPIPLVIDKIRIEKTYMTKYDVYITVSMV